MTSWRHNRDVKINIMTQNHVYFIWENLFFLQLKVPFFYSPRSHSQDTVERFCFNPTAWHRDVMTSRHDATKLIFPISACRCALERWFFFCFYDTLGCWIRKCCQFCICMMTSRYDVISWRQKQAVLYLSL